MAYRISQPLAETQFDDDKPKKKKKVTTKTKTRTLRGMSVRQADKARSGSTDRVKTTTKTTVEKPAKVKSSKVNKKSGLTSKQESKIERLAKSDKKKTAKGKYTYNRAKLKKDKLIAKNKEKARKKKQKDKDKATWANATPAEKEAMNTQQKRNRKNKLKDFAKKLGIAKKDSQMGSKNRKGRVDPNCGTAGQNQRATKKSCAAPKNK